MDNKSSFKEIRKNGVRVVLKYKNVPYVIFDDLYVFHEDSNDDEAFSHELFMWKEGNFACDCNRSLFIRRQHGEEFPDMTCGHTIELAEIGLANQTPVGKGSK